MKKRYHVESRYAADRANIEGGLDDALDHAREYARKFPGDEYVIWEAVKVVKAEPPKPGRIQVKDYK